MSDLSQPVRFLRDAGGYYTIPEIAKAINHHPADVKAAVAGALKRRQIESRPWKGTAQFRWPS